MTDPTPSIIQVPAVSGTIQANIDNVTVTTDAGVAQRQVVSIGDPAQPSNYQQVDAQGNALTRIGPSSTSLLTSSIIDFNDAGDATLVNGVENQIIRVYRIAFNVGGPTQLIYKAGSTALSGAKPFLMGGAEYLDLSGEPWFTCGEGEDFILNSSEAVQVGGTVYYVQE